MMGMRIGWHVFDDDGEWLLIDEYEFVMSDYDVICDVGKCELWNENENTKSIDFSFTNIRFEIYF